VERIKTLDVNSQVLLLNDVCHQLTERIRYLQKENRLLRQQLEKRDKNGMYFSKGRSGSY